MDNAIPDKGALLLDVHPEWNCWVIGDSVSPFLRNLVIARVLTLSGASLARSCVLPMRVSGVLSQT